VSKRNKAAGRAAREQQATQRQTLKKRAALQRQLTRAAVVLAVIALAAWYFYPRPGSYSPGSSGDFIQGVQRFQNPTGHTEGPVDYPQTPPAGGIHNPVWLNCGIYSEPVPNVYAVHSMEHGAIWVTYRPDLPAEDLDTLRDYLPSSYAILSPYAGLATPIVLSGWNVQLGIDSVADPRLPRFFEEYWRSQNVPEPGALCSGGLDGPGRQ
jgi:hypothetical protein